MKRKTIILAAVGLGCIAISKMARRRREAEWLDGKVVLITGSSRGFGLAMAEEFGKRGARLILTARDPEELGRAARSLFQRGIVQDEESILVLPCDLTDAEQAAHMVAQAEHRYGRIDILVNNAGVISVGPVEKEPLSAFAQAIESNYYTALHTTMATLPGMLSRGKGNIVNISSIGGKVAVPHLLPYSASKFALVGFSQGLNAEVRTKGVQVTTVCPGLMRTGSHLQATFTGDREREYRWFSLGASLPGASVSARSAARQVVHATVTGADELIISPQAALAAKVAQLAPSFTAKLLGWVNLILLPDPVGSNTPLQGRFVRERELPTATVIGEADADSFNQG